ncbi:phage capsid protein, partial [Limosilactobacillus reuteri]
MSQTLTYVMGADRRAHVDNIQDFKVDFSDDNHNWVQARQFERGMRQVFVNVTNEDGTPFDLTGCNVWFEGLLPKTADGDFRVIDDDGYVPLDPSAGKFRYDMPGHAFTVAGSYRQAFFRILKNNNSVTTLEFDLDVLADKVIDGLVPKTWIGPFNEIADQLVESLQKHTDDADKILADFQKKVGDLIAQLNQQGSTTTSMLT